MRYTSMAIGFALAAFIAMGAGGPWDRCPAKAGGTHHRAASSDRRAAHAFSGDMAQSPPAT